LVQIGPVVLEELIKMQKANDRWTTSGTNSSPDPNNNEIKKNALDMWLLDISYICIRVLIVFCMFIFTLPLWS
jgi:hypothetical protein